MGALRPVPFAALCRRLLREAERGAGIFDLPAARFVTSPGAGRDLTTRVHGDALSTPLGPAAGPHTQLAQNIVLSFLAGGRAIELKTVQVRDDLAIPRPCIDARTVGYNVEWSQELRIEESIAEYVKASMLVDVLVASGLVPFAPGFTRAAFEASVGYDLAGISGLRVAGFLRALTDARAEIDRLRREIPDEYRRFRDLDVRAQILSGVTLSTFHGCPPEEIERIAAHLFEAHRLPVVIKLSPTLLGARDLRALLHDALGYHEVIVPDAAFAHDLSWEDALGLVERSRRAARAAGLGFGIKLTNTLVVENRAGLLPASEPVAYLSGKPLHVLAVELVRRFRRAIGADLPISFSGGVDAENFPDAVALGLAPVTVCTDWLKTGGYARGKRYFEGLGAAMDRAGARTIDDFILRAFGQAKVALARLDVDPHRAAACARAIDEGKSLREAAGDDLYPRWVAEAARANTESYADAVRGDERYKAAANARAPRKTGKHLTLLDCLACDKCIPVCPNDANFSFTLGCTQIDVSFMRKTAAGWERRAGEALSLPRDHQIGNVADLCNACGNCEVFCPEHGAPYRVKPRFFLDPEALRADAGDGLFVSARRVLARVDGRLVEIVGAGGEGARIVFTGPDFAVDFDAGDPEGTLAGEAIGEVDLGLYRVLDHLRRAALAPGAENFPKSMEPT